MNERPIEYEESIDSRILDLLSPYLGGVWELEVTETEDTLDICDWCGIDIQDVLFASITVDMDVKIATVCIDREACMYRASVREG